MIFLLNLKNENVKYYKCIYRKIPLIRPPVYKPPEYMPPQIRNPITSQLKALVYTSPRNISPGNFSSLLNIKFTKNVTLLQVFLCILLVQFIYLVSPKVENVPKLVPGETTVRTTSNNPSQLINFNNRNKCF